MLTFIIPSEYKFNLTLRQYNSKSFKKLTSKQVRFMNMPMEYAIKKLNSELNSDFHCYILPDNYEDAILYANDIVKNKLTLKYYVIRRNGNIEEIKKILQSGYVSYKVVGRFGNDYKNLNNYDHIVISNYDDFNRNIYPFKIADDTEYYFDNYEDAKKIQILYLNYMIDKLNRSVDEKRKCIESLEIFINELKSNL